MYTMLPQLKNRVIRKTEFDFDHEGLEPKGRICTTARLVNILPEVVNVKPGLLSIADLLASLPLSDIDV